MKLSFLGTGDAKQVPVWGCECKACTQANFMSTLHRQPSCAALEIDGHNILLDAGLERIDQLFKPNDIDAIFITHFHVDHVQGLFKMRWGVGESIPVFCPRDKYGCADLYKHSGIFKFSPFKKILTPVQPIPELPNVKVTAVPLNHSKETLGYCIEANHQRVAYLCDTKGLPFETENFLTQWQPDIIVLDCTYPPNAAQENENHNSLDDVLAVHKTLTLNNLMPEIWLTHISHEMDCYLLENWAVLPANVFVAKDQQSFGIGMGHQSSDQSSYLIG